MLNTLLSPKVPRRRGGFSIHAMIAAGVWCGGCVFFENKYDPCFDDPTCKSTETAVTGDGDATSGAPGSGGELVAGDGDSGGDGDGDGDGDTGSSGGKDSRGGGAPGVGGREPDAAGGETTDDGSGGKNEVGGTDAGGGAPESGGAPSGGDTGGGGINGGSTRLVINEMRLNPSGFIEIYNASNQVLDLTHFAVTTGSDEPNWASACVLSGSLQAGQWLEVTSGSDCRGQPGCITGCTWTLSLGDRAYVLYAEQQTFDEVVDDRLYPSNVTVAIGQSYSATSDGNATFAPLEQTPGMSNGEN